MIKLIFCSILLLTSWVLYAQETPAKVPPVKNSLDVKTPKLPQQPLKITAASKDTLPLVNLEALMLTSHSWHLIRWWITPDAGHSIADPSFKFKTGGIISCNLSTPEAVTFLQSGSYTMRQNNVNIVLKKDASVTMNCTLVYNSADKSLSGTYILQVLPIPNPPSGYTPGTVTGDMKLTIKP